MIYRYVHKSYFDKVSKELFSVTVDIRDDSDKCIDWCHNKNTFFRMPSYEGPLHSIKFCEFTACKNWAIMERCIWVCNNPTLHEITRMWNQ